MANDENKFLPIFQILDIKNVSFLPKLEMALATTIRIKFEPVCQIIRIECGAEMPPNKLVSRPNLI